MATLTLNELISNLINKTNESPEAGNEEVDCIIWEKDSGRLVTINIESPKHIKQLIKALNHFKE